MPEEAWRYIPPSGEALIAAEWPQADPKLIDDELEARMNVYLDLAREIRKVRGEYKVDPGKRIRAIVRASDKAHELVRYSYILKRLCHVAELRLIAADAAEPEHAAGIAVGDISVYLPLEGMLDIEAECRRLKAEKERLRRRLGKTESMLGNASFVSRARPDVVQRERERLVELQSAHSQIEERLSKLCP